MSINNFTVNILFFFLDIFSYQQGHPEQAYHDPHPCFSASSNKVLTAVSGWHPEQAYHDPHYSCFSASVDT